MKTAKKLRRLLALILAMAACLSVIPTLALAAEREGTAASEITAGGSPAWKLAASAMPKTGDNFPVVPLICLLILSALGVCVLIIAWIKQKK